MKENKLGVMPISKLIWNMSLPIIASMLVQALYNIVDSVFVSMVNEQSLTAVSLAFPAQQLMIGLATGTAVGVNALMGRALGAKQQERADRVAINGVFLALLGFVLCAALVEPRRKSDRTPADSRYTTYVQSLACLIIQRSVHPSAKAEYPSGLVSS